MSSHIAALRTRALSIVVSLALALGLMTSIGTVSANAAAGDPGVISGTVTNPDGVVLAGVAVHLHGQTGSEAGQDLVATTTSEGVYTFSNLDETGTYVVWIDPISGQPWTYIGTEANVALSAAAPTATRNFHFRLATGSVTGRVLDADGAPMSGVSVQIQTNGNTHAVEVSTAANGTFTLTGLLLDEAYFIRFNPVLNNAYLRELWENTRDHDQATFITLTAANPTYALPRDVTLDRGGRISGTVFYQDGVTPFPNVTVWSWNKQNSSLWAEFPTTTAADGTFTTNGMEPTSQLVLQFDTNLNQIPDAGDEFWQNQSTMAGATALTVTADTTTPLSANVVLDVAASLPVINPAPVPTISDTTPQVAQTINAVTGTWQAGTTFAYQWQRGTTDIAGATSANYTVQVADLGATLRVRVTGTRTGSASTSQISASTTAVAAAPFTASPLPTISGTAQVGEVLTASAGTWAPVPTTLAYQWYANDVAIGGATTSTYTVASATLNQMISVRVTASLNGYITTDRDSVDVGPVVAAGSPPPSAFGNAPIPSITGTAQVGKTLTAVPGSWSPAPSTLAYQWFRGTAEISGATAVTYPLVAADQGAVISVRVTGSLAGYATTSRDSAGVGPVSAATPPVTPPAAPKPFTAIPTPSYSPAGVPSVGQVLTAKPGAWAPAPVTLSYQWLRDNVAIKGATAATYRVTAADLKKKISVRVTGSKTGYITASKTSEAGTVKEGKLTAAVPKITGTIAKGGTLTAKPGTWTAGTKFTYQWYRDGKSISGATKATYKLTSSDKGKKIKVKVTGKLTGYLSAAKVSTQTAKVATVGTPKITGTVKVGKTLSISKGTWTSKTSFSYRWYRNGVFISKATKSTYKLTAADQGKKITVKVTGKKSGYATIAKTTKATSAVKAK